MKNSSVFQETMFQFLHVQDNPQASQRADSSWKHFLVKKLKCPLRGLEIIHHQHSGHCFWKDLLLWSFSNLGGIWVVAGILKTQLN